jgi:hypothetical protein
MSLRRSLSLLLRMPMHSVLKKSVHSVAVIGAPFSQGQVRVETGTDLQNPEKVAVWYGGPGEDGEERRGEEPPGSRGGALGSTWGFPGP